MRATAQRRGLVSAGLVGTFAACTALTATGRLAGLDRAGARLVVDPGSALIRPLRWLATAGGGEATLVACAVLAVISVGMPRWRALVIVLIAALVATAIVEYVMKTRLDHPPPTGVTGGSDLRLVLLTTPFSYPSGHTLRSALTGVTLWLMLRDRVPGVGLVLSGLVAVVVASRLFLGDHWASDVVGGALLAGACIPWLLAVGERGRTTLRGAS